MERAIPVAKLYDRNEITDEMFPVIVKPKYRRISNLNKSNINMSKELDNRRITVIKNSHELNNYVQENVTILPYIMFQEHIPGMADCMYTVGIYANKEYEVLGVFEGRKVRGFPPDIGDCVVGQSEKLPPGIVDLVKETVKELHLSGITEFEFKKNPDTGEFRLIEINPRSWSWIGITPACGVDLPLIAYNDLTGKHETYKESMYDHGDVKYIKLIDDFKNCLYKNKKAGFDQYHMGLKQWWVSLKAKKCMFAGFEKNDILPGLFQIIQMLKNK
ncbi:MAG: ATP-grasp domain-containing protein [Dehalococcoidales bacterium]|nr:ATP-grasp domain-containing protein [Dehalococcoidales bacterium]